MRGRAGSTPRGSVMDARNARPERRRRELPMNARTAARALVGALTCALLAAAAAPALALDLMQAWREALANDAQVASARAQLDATRERVPLARSHLPPRVCCSAADHHAPSE